MTVVLQSIEKKVPKSKKGDLGLKYFQDHESVLSSFILTIIIHFLVYFTIPKAITTVSVQKREKVNEVEYVYQDIEKESKPEQKRFVEANPDVPINLPDNTLNIAARDQQAAQEKTAKIINNETPYLDGEEELSPKILVGEYIPQSQSAIEVPKQPISVQGAIKTGASFIDEGVVFALPEPQPIPYFIDREADAEEGMASILDPDEAEDPIEHTIDRLPLAINLNSNNVEGEIVRNHNNQIQSTDTQPQMEPQLPKPRPRLSSDVLPGPTMKSMSGVSGLGMIAIESKFSEFGDYLQRMYEAIGYQWLLLANQTRRASAQISSRVILKFIIFNRGDIENLEVVHSTAGQAATIICKDAVQSRSPFGVWTDEMVRTLGQEQIIRVTFIYQ